MNPAEGTTDKTDPQFGNFEDSAQEEVWLRGNRGLMVSKRGVQFLIGWDNERVVSTTGLVLKEHVQGFPRVILGRKSMFDDLGGMQMRTTEAGVEVLFQRWPGVHESGRHPPE
jgi:hypothetical protein